MLASSTRGAVSNTGRRPPTTCPWKQAWARLARLYRVSAVLGLSLLAWAAHAQVVVTTTADIPVDEADCVTAGSDTCTLRAAIDRLNRFAVSPRRIEFQLPGAGPHVIRLEPALGSLNWNSSGELDGLTQQGAGRRFGSDPENPVDYVLQVGIAAPLFQTINGPLMVISGGGTLRGIAFFDHDGIGVRLQSGVIERSFFNTLNGTDPGPRTLTTGVEYRATDSGTFASVYSSLFMGPGRGVELHDARSSGTEAIAQPTIGESYFGTDRTGLLPRPLEYGVLAQVTTAAPVIFGRPRPVEPSIRGSLFYLAERNAVRLRGTTPYLDDNVIGFDAAGARVTGVPPVTQGAGILIEGPNYAGEGGGGHISYVKVYGQRGPGIQLDDTHGPITNLAILPAAANARSSIFGNGALGISLNPAAPATPTPNDAGDGDTGPNGRQNHPVIESIQRSLDQWDEERLVVGLRLESRPNRAYQLQFFANSQCDPSGHGEGEVVLANEFDENGGQVLTDGAGVFSGTITLGGQGINTLLERLDGRPFVTALATDASDSTTGEGGNTSEFSPCYDAGNLDPPGQQLGFDRREYTFREGQTASVLVQRTGGTNGEVRVLLATSDGTAQAGRDYETVRRDLVFSDGTSAFGVQIPLRADDAEAQPTREFTVQLFVPTGGTGGATIDPYRASATVRIEDDDVNYQVRDSVGSENDGRMDFGGVEYGSFAEGTVTIRNLGVPRVTFESIEFVRTPVDDRFREVGRTCGEFLDQDQSCTVTIRFAPGDLDDPTPATPVVAQGELSIVPTAGPPRTVTVAAVAPPRADLGLEFNVVDPINPDPGGTVQFRVLARNFGPADAATSTARVTLPPELAIPGVVSSSQGTVSSDSSSIDWEVGALAAGGVAELEWSATVDPGTERGTQLTVTGSLELTDPRRFDPSGGPSRASQVLLVGEAASDLSVRARVIVSTGSGPEPASTIPILPRCITSRDPDRDPEHPCDYQPGTNFGVSLFRGLVITVQNNGPDTASGPVVLRVGSGFCYDWAWVETGRFTDGRVEYRAQCQDDTPVREIPINDFSLAPGSELGVYQRFASVSGPTGTASIEVELVHDTFDPDENNNFAVVGPLQVVIPTSSSTGSFCFIATAAYGSWLDPHVATLRAFRDRWLLTNAPGRAFVGWYYRASPPLAEWIATREWARAVTRGMLAPIVFSVGHPGMAGALVFIVFGSIWRRRVRRRPSAGMTP